MAGAFPWYVTYGIRAGPITPYGLRDLSGEKGSSPFEMDSFMIKILNDVTLCTPLDLENKILIVKLTISIPSQTKRIMTIFYFPDFLVYIPLLSKNLIEMCYSYLQ